MKDPIPYSFHSDIYAYGIVLYELLTSSLPYAHVGNKDQVLFLEYYHDKYAYARHVKVRERVRSSTSMAYGLFFQVTQRSRLVCFLFRSSKYLITDGS